MVEATDFAKSSDADPAPAAQPPAAGEDRIRLRAYELYEQRNGNPGDAEGDWYRAEAELRQQSDTASSESSK